MTLIDKAEAHDMQTITEQAAKDARDVFESYGSKSREAIDYMEQLIYAALRKTEPALPARGVGVKPLVKDMRWIMEERDRTFALMLERAEKAEARAERLEAALRLLHDNVVLAFPTLADLGPVANARAALKGADHE